MTGERATAFHRVFYRGGEDQVRDARTMLFWLVWLVLLRIFQEKGHGTEADQEGAGRYVVMDLVRKSSCS